MFVYCPSIMYSVFFFYCFLDHRDLHSFPTRRSSDLIFANRLKLSLKAHGKELADITDDKGVNVLHLACARGYENTVRIRSEEHTSELQSRVDLVCRLLLEKKNKNKLQYTAYCA